MHAMLGKIVHVAPGEAGAFTVKFTPVCVLPSRSPIPDWLKDQTLSVARIVADPREMGGEGDSIVLTPAESSAFLNPLSVTPAVASGSIPAALALRLRWWKDADKAPDFSVRAGGRQQTGQWVKEDDGGWTATIETSPFFDGPPPRLPVSLIARCDALETFCAVLPADSPCVVPVVTSHGERQRLQNDWYEVDIATKTNAGAIAGLRERGREREHFARTETLIENPMNIGLADFVRQGWNQNYWEDAAIASAGARRDSGQVRLTLEGVADEGQNLRTTVACALHDRFPLLTWERTYFKGKAKEPDEKDKAKPRAPIDDVLSLGCAFRLAWPVERGGEVGSGGSRILCADGERLAVIRPARSEEGGSFDEWRLDSGWTLTEHPARGDYMLTLFDAETPPHLDVFAGLRTLNMKPFWRARPLRPEGAIGCSFALTAGEQAGASARGAWVACRAMGESGGIRCAVVARLRDGGTGEEAVFTLGNETRRAPLETLFLPGIGPLQAAVADFDGADIDDALTVTCAGIAARRSE